MLFTCSVCGQVHEGFPSIGFDAPYVYHNLSITDKEKIAELSDDFCVIRHSDQTDHFIRVVLNQKIIDFPETLQYGVWISLSEKSFNDYKKHYNSTDYLTTYFGYLCNQLPDYENTLLIKTNVQTAPDNNRPEIFPHYDQTDNPFVRDYFEGISLEEAERRIHAAYGEDID